MQRRQFITLIGGIATCRAGAPIGEDEARCRR
jgi:hypothetical protein